MPAASSWRSMKSRSDSCNEGWGGHRGWRGENHAKRESIARRSQRSQRGIGLAESPGGERAKLRLSRGFPGCLAHNVTPPIMLVHVFARERQGHSRLLLDRHGVALCMGDDVAG